MFRGNLVRVLAVTVAMSAALVVAPQCPAAGNARSAYGGPINRTQVMVRALDWLRRDLAYSQDNREARWDLHRGRRYRPDCSGFVSMAWAIDPRRPGLGRALVTWELPGVSTRIPWRRLRRGDILLHLQPANRAEEHVQLFAGWVDPARTRAWVLEQSGRAHGMRRKAVVLAAARRGYLPYRYRRIV
jgi:hypothetical protein